MNRNMITMGIGSIEQALSAFKDRQVVIDPISKNSYLLSRYNAERCAAKAGVSVASGLTWQCVQNCFRDTRSVGEQLTAGLATVTKVTSTLFPNGLSSVTVTIRVEVSGTEANYIKVKISDLQTTSADLRESLQRSGIVFMTPGAFRIWCINALQHLQFCHHETVHAGLFVDDKGKLDSDNAKELLLSSAEAIEIDDALTKAGLEELFLLLDLFSDVAVVAVNRIIGLPPYVSVYVVGDNPEAVGEIEQLYGVDAIPLSKVNYEVSDSELLLVDATLETKYIVITRIPRLLQMASRVPVVLITQKPDQIPDNGFVLQRFRSSSLFPVNRIRETMYAIMLKRPEIHLIVNEQLEKVGNFFDELDEITKVVCTAKCVFATLLLVYSKRDEAAIEAIKERYKNYLYDNFGLLGTGFVLRKLRKILSCGSVRFAERLSTSKEEIANSVLFDRETYYFTPLAVNSLAESLRLSTKQLVLLLRNEGALEMGDKSQKVVSVKGNEQIRAYAVKKSSIFMPGEITAGGNGFAGGFPEIMLPLGCDESGTCGYLTFRDRFGTDNANVLITGQPGSGKTFLVDHIALTAAKRGFPVVYLITAFPRYPITGAEIVEITEEMLDEKSDFSIKEFVNGAPRDVFSEDEREILKLFNDVKARFQSVADVEDYIRQELGDDVLVDSIVQKMRKRSSNIDWSQILSDGKIVYLVAEDNWNDNRDEDCLSNQTVMSLFLFKQQRDQSPCLLIIDEAQDFDLGQKAPISQYVLRQGRKYGFITLLASQFLSALDGRNIAKTIRLCETQIVFTPQNDAETRKKLDPHGKCRELEQILGNVPRYNFVVSGHISSDDGMLDYPVILHVTND